MTGGTPLVESSVLDRILEAEVVVAGEAELLRGCDEETPVFRTVGTVTLGALPFVDGGVDGGPFVHGVVASVAEFTAGGDEEASVLGTVGTVTLGAFSFVDGGVDRSLAVEFVVALVAEGAALFHEAELLGIPVVFVTGGAVAAVDGIVGVRDGRQDVVTLIAGWFFPCGRRRKSGGAEYGQRRQGGQQFVTPRHDSSSPHFLAEVPLRGEQHRICRGRRRCGSGDMVRELPLARYSIWHQVEKAVNRP
jgi:hypothetical protein